MFVNITSKVSNILKPGYRRLATKIKLNEDSKAQAWQVHSYGGLEELQFGAVRIPHIKSADEVLINVEAASVNPIDLLMLGGYGRTLFQIPRNFEMELPLTLGRDFCGTIIYKGHDVGNKFNVGDKVYGFIPIHKQGSFSDVVVACKSHICKQPQHLSSVESSSLVYTSMTAWSALYLFGNLLFKEPKGTRVLILGASGGVGTAAVQLLKSQGCTVFGSCSTDAIPLVRSLGADCVFDYKEPDYLKNVQLEGYYHIILDCAKFGYDNVPANWKFGTYITLNSPLLLNTDKLGLVGGLLSSAGILLRHNLKPPGNQRCLIWGFFVPSGSGFQFIDKLIHEEKIRPSIHKEFTFEKLPEAFEELQRGHMRGKIVVKH